MIPAPLARQIVLDPFGVAGLYHAYGVFDNLALTMRAGLRIHSILRKRCRYGNQLRLLRTAARRRPDTETSLPVLSVRREARERIKRALQGRKKQGGCKACRRLAT